MDDIQFWLYAAFAAIYFFTRMFKKKKLPEGGAGELEQPSQRSKPVSFEELLKEFTQEEKSTSRELEPVPQKSQAERERVKENPQEYQEQKFEEGRTRRFSDEESRRVYEESVKRAEASKLVFEKEDYFKSSIEREAEEEETSAASDIREMLSDSDSAKRAIILGEILNRKY